MRVGRGRRTMTVRLERRRPKVVCGKHNVPPHPHTWQAQLVEEVDTCRTTPAPPAATAPLTPTSSRHFDGCELHLPPRAIATPVQTSSLSSPTKMKC